MSVDNHQSSRELSIFFFHVDHYLILDSLYIVMGHEAHSLLLSLRGYQSLLIIYYRLEFLDICLRELRLIFLFKTDRSFFYIRPLAAKSIANCNMDYSTI